MAGYVSDAVVRRLPGYYRHLSELIEKGVQQISSQELGERMRLTASQIRQDINCFGGFGRQGYGYNVVELRKHIGSILGLDRQHSMMIVGAGNIGRAIAQSDSFTKDGFISVALFDQDEHKIGRQVGKLTVRDAADMETFLRQQPIDVSVLAVPAASAQEVADRLYSHGQRAIWNFAPVDLKLPEDAAVVNVHLSDSLQILSFRMRQLSGEEA